MDYDTEMLQRGTRLPIPFRALTPVSLTLICSIYHFLEASKSRHGTSLKGSLDSYHKPQHLCNHHGMNLPSLSTGAQTQGCNDSFWPRKCWLSLSFPLWCSLFCILNQIRLKYGYRTNYWVMILVYFILLSPNSLSSFQWSPTLILTTIKNLGNL